MPRRTLLLIQIAFFLQSSLVFADSNSSKEEDIVTGSIQALDHFMRASQKQDTHTAARWMAKYDVYPPKAIYDSRRIMNQNKSVLSDYLSIDSDIYGYEIKRALGNVTVLIEGAIRSASGQAGEYSARMVFTHKRWRILDIDINPM